MRREIRFLRRGHEVRLSDAAPTPTPLDREDVQDWIAGNLCLCTGYRPIVDAALSSCGGTVADRFTAQEPDVVKALEAISDDEDLLVGSEHGFFAAPASIGSLAAL